MRLLSHLLLSATDLAEAGARAFRRGIMRLLTGAAVMLVGAVFLLAGLWLIVLGIYTLLLPAAGPAGSAFISGTICLVLAALLVLVARGAAS